MKDLVRQRVAVATYHKRQYDKILSLKQGPCMDCGGSFPPVCMDFDHRPGVVKLFAIATGLNRSMESVKAEIAKCDLVCANCHRIRTHSRLIKVEVKPLTRAFKEVCKYGHSRVNNADSRNRCITCRRGGKEKTT